MKHAGYSVGITMLNLIFTFDDINVTKIAEKSVSIIIYYVVSVCTVYYIHLWLKF